jgi:hypothetical protein
MQKNSKKNTSNNQIANQLKVLNKIKEELTNINKFEENNITETSDDINVLKKNMKKNADEPAKTYIESLFNQDKMKSTMDQVQQLVTYFVSNPQAFSKFITQISAMVDNLTEKFDPVSLFNKEKSLDTKKSNIAMNLALKYIELLKLMQSKFIENLNYKCENNVFVFDQDAVLFNSHLSKVWNIVKMILCEMIILKVDEISCFGDKKCDITLDAPQLFILPQEMYQHTLECIGFPQVDNKIDSSKVYYSGNVLKLIENFIYLSQYSLVLTFRNMMNIHYTMYNDIILESFSSFDVDPNILCFWEAVNNALCNDISAKYLYFILSDNNKRLNIENGTELNPDDVLIKEIILCEKNITVSFVRLYHAITKIEKITFGFTNRFLRKVYNSNPFYLLGVHYNDNNNVTDFINGFDIIEEDCASLIFGSLYLISLVINVTATNKHLINTVTRKIITTMDISDFNIVNTKISSFYDDVLCNIMQNVTVTDPIFLPDPIKEFNLNLLNSNCEISRCDFINKLTNPIIFTYSTILTPYYSISNKENLAKLLYTALDKDLLKDHVNSLNNFINQLCNDIKISITLYQKLVETYNVIAKPQQLCNPPVILQNYDNN